LCGAGCDPTGRTRPEEPDLSGINLGVRAGGLDRSDGICGYEAEVPVDIGAAIPVRLTNTPLVVGEECDPVVDVRGYQRPVHEPRLLAAAMKPNDCWMVAILAWQID